MIVYHGSIVEVVKPEVNRSYRNLDFGQDALRQQFSLSFLKHGWVIRIFT